MIVKRLPNHIIFLTGLNQQEFNRNEKCVFFGRMFRYRNNTMMPASVQRMMANEANTMPESSITRIMKRGELCYFNHKFWLFTPAIIISTVSKHKAVL